MGLLGSRAQTLMGESSRIITAYLAIKQAKYHTVYDSCSNAAFITVGVDGGTAVYYFRDDVCDEFTSVTYQADPAQIQRHLDAFYRRQGDLWWDDVQNTWIAMSYVNETVFINVVRWY
jgi:hypothetical protein